MGKRLALGLVPVPAFMLHARVSAIQAAQSLSSWPACHLKHLLALKSTRRKRSLVRHIPTSITDGKRVCDDALSLQASKSSLGTVLYYSTTSSCAARPSVGHPVPSVRE